MRPVEITMSAFGSYAKETVIDFRDASQGIFLITGDTGAGKTTIFDAITYALYDRTSGGKRDGNMMRSQYAKEDEETYVRFTFQYDQKEYTIIRSPRYQVRSKRKNKDGTYHLVNRNPSVELIMPDNTVYPGKISAVNAKIVEIIGLDATQFTQIAMIAQGDFMELLHARSDDRKAIFARIFNTRIYENIQAGLRERTRALSHQLEDNQKSYEQDLQGVQLAEEAPMQEAWEVLIQQKEGRMGEIIALLGTIADWDQECEEAIRDKIYELEQQLQKLQKQEEVIRQFEEQKKNYVQICSRKEELEQERPVWESWKQKIDQADRANAVYEKEWAYSEQCKEGIRLEQAQKECEEGLKKQKESYEKIVQQKQAFEENEYAQMDEIQSQMTVLRESAEEYNLLLRLQQESEARLEEQKQHWEQKKILTAGIEQQQKEVKELQEQQEVLKDAKSRQNIVQKEKEQLQKDLSELGGLEQQLTSYNVLDETLQKAKKQMEEASEKAKKARNEMEEQDRLFLQEQAGILAETLQEGQKCPVCGSLHHPEPCQRSAAHVDQNTLNAARRKSREADLDYQEAQRSFLKEQQKQKVCLGLLQSYHERLFGIPMDTIEGLAGKACAKKESWKEKEQGLEQEYDRQVQNSRQYEQNQIDLQKKSEKIEQDQKELQTVEHKILRLEERQKQAKVQIEDLQGRLPEKTQQQAKAKWQALSQKRKELELREQKYIQLWEQEQSTLRRLEGNLESLCASVQRAKEKEKELELAFKESQKEAGFENREEYEKAKCPKEKLKEWKEHLQEKQQEWIRIETKEQQLREQLEKNQPQEQQIDSKLQEKVRQQLSEQQKREKEIYTRKMRNLEAYQNLRAQYKDRQKLEAQYSLLSDLDRTANGNLSGKSKLDLQTFIQRAYFEEIIEEANKRLAVMTNQRFILTCRKLEELKNQGSVGLDLDVYQPLTGKNRDVKTLSGGESFMAALAMAFGMADVIQNTAGRIHMDMMFIDEGFGSLDELSRRQAIRVLQELAGDSRMIGIISHVTELKEQIGRKLVVSKTNRGSKIDWEMEAVKRNE